MIKVTNEVREAARRLLSRVRAEDTRKRLWAIAKGKSKLIDADWWRKVYGDPHGDAYRAKLDKITALADPARNANEYERQVAATKLAAAKLAAPKARRPPGMRPEPPPLPEQWIDRRKRKTKTPPSPQPSRKLSDSVTVSDSVAASVNRLKALNERRAARRAARRTSLKCQSCGKPLAAQRATARYCNVTCRSQAWRAKGRLTPTDT